MEFIKNIANRINNSILNNVSGKEKKQSLIMFTIAVALIAGNAVINASTRPQPIPDNPMITDKLALLDTMYHKRKLSDTLNRLDLYITRRYDTINLFKFDPNKVSKQELLKLGFSDKQAGNLLSYRDNGGKFKTDDDLRKLYGMRPLQYRILRPYISIADTRKTGSATGKEPAVGDKQNTPQASYFAFDPNSVTEQALIELGMSQKQASSFVKYRNGGKKFYVPEDMKSSYSVSENLYGKLKPYIRINTDSLMNGQKLYDLNLATANDLAEAGLSVNECQKILEFRDLLGYFYANWQISDCIDRRRANTLKDKFYVCASVEITKLDINGASAEQLARHPYIGDKAEMIIEKRRVKNIESISELKDIFDEREIKKIRNYLLF